MNEPFKLEITKDVSYLELPKVLVLYTGGAIGMMEDPNDPDGGLTTVKNKLKEHCLTNACLNDMTYADLTDDLRPLWLVLPQTNSLMKRVVYYIHEYNYLIDSSNMTPMYWAVIASDIKANYSDFDGFVILHGTDTMAYTASALSFMISCSSKSIVLTGSERPIFTVDTDGTNNLTNAISIAGNYRVPDVCVFFYDRLLRGNRCVKRSAQSDFGFNSPNVAPLLLVGSPPCERYLLAPQKKGCKMKIHRKMNVNISVLRFFPGIQAQEVQRNLGLPYEGVVMQTYGAGNIPTDRSDVLHAIKTSVERGAIIINCTQCHHGTVTPIYATGKVLTNLGVICGNDITVQAAITKLMYVMSKKKLSLEQKKNLMKQSIRGEMTPIHS